MNWLDRVRRVGKVVVGAILLLIGIALLVLPGPGFVGIIAGLAILSTEFVWAARLLQRAKDNAKYAADSVLGTADTERAASIWTRIRSRFGSSRPRAGKSRDLT
jgi:uncharacterized protein (TIGR02611 family)